MATHIRLGGQRIELRSGGSIRDAADMIAGLTRANLRQLIDDPALAEEAIRRALSIPCIQRCYARTGPGGVVTNDCNCPSGFQYSSDDEQQAVEGCPARDVWSDWRSLLKAHQDSGRGDDDPIIADCDDLTPAAISVAAYLSWYAPPTLGIGGFAIGKARDDDARYAIAITMPPPPKDPGGILMAHAYGLTNRRPAQPQPPIQIGEWFVWDSAAHWGMKRPRDEFYASVKPGGDLVAFEIRRQDLEGIRLL